MAKAQERSLSGRVSNVQRQTELANVQFSSDSFDRYLYKVIYLLHQCQNFLVACGGVVAKIGESFQSPNYPLNYPHGVTCVWQIAFSEPIEVDFAAFKTVDNHDKLEIWSSLTTINGKIYQYFALS